MKEFSRSALNFFTLVSVLSLTLIGCDSERKVMPKAVDGVIDLSSWDFEKDGIAELKGEWRFVWEEFVEPMPSEVFRDKYKGTIEVPAIWRSESDSKNNHKQLSPQGYGTYVLEVWLPSSSIGESLGIATDYLSTASHYRVVDATVEGILAEGRQGIVGATKATSIPVWINSATNFVPGSVDKIVVWLQVSNFHYGRGGAWFAPDLGLSDDVSYKLVSAYSTNVVIFGICFIISLYHFVLFFQRQDDFSALFFGIFCGAVAIRQWCTGLIGQKLGYGHSDFGFGFVTSLEYIATPVAAIGCGFFIYTLNPERRFLMALKFFVLGGGLLLIGFAALTPAVIFSEYVWCFNLYVLITFVISFVHLSSQAISGDNLARWAFGALMFVLIGTINDILFTQRLIQTDHIGSYTFIVFVMVQSGILSARSARAHSKADHLSKHLLKEVEEQTSDLYSKTLEAQEATLVAVEAKQESDLLRCEAEKAKENAEVMRQAAQEQTEKLKELDKQKTVFFQNMSHELRTPLTLILNPLESQVKSQPDNSEIAMAAKNSRRLLRLVNQLLDFQKLEAGKKDLKLAPLEISRFTYVCGDYFRSACSSKEISFSVTRKGASPQEGQGPLWLMGEVDALEKVAFNFLSNALKYTNRGGEIELGLRSSEERVRLYVRDTGSGISEEGQEKLFQVFSQVDESTTRAYEGTGLGLALAKSLVEEMGGTVGVESALEEGSTFWAEFPLLGSPMETIDLLLVDDDEFICKAMAPVFRRVENVSHFEICSSAEQALNLMKTKQVRCLVTDYQMEGRDGLSLLSEVSSLYPDTRRVLLTGEADNEVMRQAVNNSWVHQVFYKPVDTEELTGAIGDLVQESPIKDSVAFDEGFEVKPWLLAEQGETGVEESIFVEELDDSALGLSELVLVVDDLADMRDLISNSLRKRNYRVATASNGKRGVELAKEIRPDLIITDWMMPQMSGPELISILKSDDEFNSVPIILLTAKSDEESRLIGTEIGADSFLGKPFNDQELGSIAKNLLSLKSREREVENLNYMLTETILKRYISPALVDRIVSGEISMDKPAEMRLITVLFSDLSGFTKTSQNLGPQVISSFLNEYLTRMNDIIFEHGGTIDKFIGDAIMVMFGAPQDMPPSEQARRAADCSRAMQVEMERIAKDWASEGAGHLRMRIGIHQGDAIVGNFGSDKRSDYTCIGPSVNLAARIESAAYPGEVFVSHELGLHLESSSVKDVGSFELKGIDGAVRLYKLC
jgi:signal transduction histidine kinase/class 3 adenylate cyclase/two-component SAPR family response regulator